MMSEEELVYEEQINCLNNIDQLVYEEQINCLNNIDQFVTVHYEYTHFYVHDYEKGAVIESDLKNSIHNSLVEYILANKTITKLWIQLDNAEDHVINSIGTILARSNFLREYEFIITAFQPNFFQLIENLSHAKTLEIVRLSDEVNSENSKIMMTQMLQTITLNNTNISNLSLNRISFEDNTIYDHLDNLPKLEELELQVIHAINTELLAYVLKNKNLLISLTIHTCAINVDILMSALSESDNKLKKLDLYNEELTDFRSLANLVELKPINELYIRMCTSTESNIGPLLTMLKCNNTISKLTLGYNRFIQLNEIVNIFESITNNTTLTSLSIMALDCRPIADSIHDLLLENYTLTDIEFNCYATDDKINQILARNKQITDNKRFFTVKAAPTI